MSFEHQYPYGDVNELNLDWVIQTMQEFINSERQAGNTPTVSSVRSFFTHKYPKGDIHELNLDWLIETALRMSEIGDSVEGDIGELQTRMTSAEGNISTLDNTVGGLSDSIDEIGTEIENINDAVEELQTAVTQHTTQIEALDDKIDSQVVANPAGAATDTLSKIEIAGTVYGVEGSGGSEVEANPSGEPTDTLETIGIDGTIYGVSGSGEPVSKTATGNPIHIEDAADAPIVSGEVAFEPQQDLHGYDKPWAGGAGKNKFGGTFGEIFTFAAIIPAQTVITISFKRTSQDQGNAVTVNLYTSGSESRYDWYTVGGENRSITLTQDTARIMLYGSADITDIQVEISSTATTFEPYSNICPIEGYTDCEVEVTDDATSPTVTNTYTIDLDGTRYGGTIDAVSGVMRVDKAIVDLGSLNWQYEVQNTRFTSPNISNFIKPPIGVRTDRLYCSALNALWHGESITPNVTNGVIYTSVGGSLYAHYLNVGNDANAFKTAMSGVQLCYELATPLTVQLTPEQIRTLEGTNNISTNMTIMSLEYITQDYQPLVELIERSAGHHYSTQERVVGTWIDGKPLYEKSVEITLTNGDNLINILNAETVVISNGFIKYPYLDTYQYIPLSQWVGNGFYLSVIPQVDNNTGQVNLNVTKGGWADSPAIVTLQYTKTTD